MDPALVDPAIAVASLGLFAGAYAAARLATRPARVPAAPATPDLGDEPPAVVNLLVNRWRLTEDASESTLLDLAARGFLELRQPDNDPRHTTVHLRQAPPDDALLPYERRVLTRVRELAVQGVVPVTALTFRNQHHAQRWNRRLHHEVVEDARARGLSRRRFSAAVVTALSTVASVSAAGAAVVALRLTLREDEPNLFAPVWAGLITFAVLAGIGGRPMGERDTPGGRATAARWLGVRAWLRGHEEFANLPPAAVTVWDRYLPFGAAVGATHTASEVLDLGMGDRRLVWSSHGGQWRRVRVRYPRFWSRYGRSAPKLVLRGVLTAGAGGLLLRLLGLPELTVPDAATGAVTDPSGLVDDPAAGVDLLAWFLPLPGALLLLYGCYVLVRTLIDLATTRTVTGEVLWVEVWRAHQRKNQRAVPWLHYLAVDDGSADRTTAWGLPVLSPQVREHDVVTITVRPWSRRVTSLTVLQRGRGHTLTDAPVEEETAAAGSALRSLFGAGAAAATGAADTGAASATTAAGLLTADEVGRALGIAVRDPQPLPVPGPLAYATFVTADQGRQVLLVGIASGRFGDWAWRRANRGTALPGLGDGAYLDGDHGAVRVGAATAVLTLLGAGRDRREHLPWLLHQLVPRLLQPPRTPDRQREPA